MMGAGGRSMAGWEYGHIYERPVVPSIDVDLAHVLRVCSKRGGGRIMGDEAQTLPEPPDRRAAGDHRAADPGGLARRPAPRSGHAGGRQRPDVPDPGGVHLAGPAPRLPALEDGLQLLPVVHLGRHLAARLGRLSGGGPARRSAAPTRAPRPSTASRSRRPRAARTGGPTGARRAGAASGTSWWIPWVC